METINKAIKGGEFLIKETKSEDVFIPEEFNEEQMMMANMAHDFLATEVFPNLDRIDNHEDGLMESIMTKAGELGLLGTAVPEEYGGFGKDTMTNMLMTEYLGAGHATSVALSAHTGIGTLPILYFGTDAQKNKYLPKLASGEWKGSYCLTEPGSGSDALAAKTKAVLSEDKKHYILNGQKMWITNAGFADVFTVFAQVDGTKFTGFIVEKGYEGLSLGDEEHKMGIKGSSTRQVFLTDCKVPVENVLGEIGKGHHIAFNILNIGRAKLAAAVLGASKIVSTESIKYANTREQFGRPIAKFGAIRHKLAEQAVRNYALESAVYRVANLIDQQEKELTASGKDYAASHLGAAEEYAVECAILKVFGSEALNYAVDEGVQIFGGYGYSSDYPMDRAYRDSRINRIFEGTNEINRMLCVDMLLKRAMKGQIDLMTPTQKILGELMSIPEMGEDDTALFADEKKIILNMKKAILLVAGSAVQKFMMDLAKEQEIIMNIADMMIQAYAAESVLLRTEKLTIMKGSGLQIPTSEAIIKGSEAVAGQIDMMRVFIHEANDVIQVAAKEALNAMAEGDELRMALIGVKRFTKVPAFNSKEARRRIAKQLCEAGKYCF